MGSDIIANFIENYIKEYGERTRQQHDAWMAHQKQENPFSHSIKLPDGGDTHFHRWRDSASDAVTVTTRLRDGVTIHQDVRDFLPGPAVSEAEFKLQVEAPVWQPPPVNPML